VNNELLRLVLRGATKQLCVVTLASIGSVSAQQYNAPESSSRGVIQNIDLAHNQMVVGGNRYDVLITAKVEINGSYGAFTMLRTGTRIEFNYKKFDDGVRQIIEIRELTAGETIERS